MLQFFRLIPCCCKGPRTGGIKMLLRATLALPSHLTPMLQFKQTQIVKGLTCMELLLTLHAVNAIWYVNYICLSILAKIRVADDCLSLSNKGFRETSLFGHLVLTFPIPTFVVAIIQCL